LFDVANIKFRIFVKTVQGYEAGGGLLPEPGLKLKIRSRRSVQNLRLEPEVWPF